MYKAKLHIKFKEGVLDPQGNAVKNALKNLGFVNVNSVRIGKLVEIELDCDNVDQAKEELKSMCDKLLANPVTESYEIVSLEEIK
ncbi:phosphoribosylformylglycinamidine synthase subunit PurS [Pseudothermotoga thermarum]|uniref:Phosphoribosylformylglycinamidine synthase subunit PurS n=1 Tax=Pseudothermotoga thermarum DSM 5069 TaxID=688269 RepID=F7YWV7_9THEM|nr:phosphoribosylformylglycinamidine synthase subunit PurS [Pseudothermotoga thermarum]AEH50549.1 phosphoribosylformylglycinamidine synthase, purS [Pseudothermotoga thermarum DSM 5069]